MVLLVYPCDELKVMVYTVNEQVPRTIFIFLPAMLCGKPPKMPLRAPELTLRMHRKENSPLMSLRRSAATVAISILPHQKPSFRQKLALNWVCFFRAQTAAFLHKPLSYRYLRPFCPFENWLCFFKSYSVISHPFVLFRI